MNPTVSVIIPTCDRPTTLVQALHSITTQRGPDVEVLIVNDGGAEVGQAVARFAGLLDVRLVSRAAGAGPSTARNQAIDVAAGQYLAFLDDDDIFLPGYLASAVDRLSRGDVDLVHHTALVTDHRVDPFDPGDVRAGEAFDLPFDPDFFSVLNYIATTTVVCRSFRDAGIRFDPSLRAVEDWDLWLRLVHRHGYRIGHEPKPGGVYHRVPASGAVTAGQTAMLRMFHDCYVELCGRWPVPAGGRTDAYRRRLLDVYRLAFARHADGRQLDTFWYQRVVRLLHNGFTGSIDEDRLTELLPAALEGVASR